MERCLVGSRLLAFHTCEAVVGFETFSRGGCRAVIVKDRGRKMCGYVNETKTHVFLIYRVWPIFGRVATWSEMSD